MTEGLGSLLTFEDHQQFLGRLRRDGTAIYPSARLLRYATTGSRQEPSVQAMVDSVLAGFTQREQRHGQEGAGGAGERVRDPMQAAVGELRERVRLWKLGSAEVGAAVLSSMLQSLVAPSGGAKQEQLAGEELLKAVIKRLKRWDNISPGLLIKALHQGKAKEQAALVSALESVCIEHPQFFCTIPRLLAAMEDEDEGFELVDEDGLREWQASAARREGRGGGSALAPFRQQFAKHVERVLEWLMAAEEDSDEEE
jgi:hypothetical protein